MDMRGHNSAAYGEILNDVETILPDDHETVFRYAQWHVADYITGTMGMQLEQEGAYIRFLMRLYQRGKPLPDDDRYMATCMNLTIRVWKRVKQGLIAVGKIIAKCGCLTNARFERERQIRAATARKQAEATRLRWEKSRREKQGLTEVSAKFAPSLAETSRKLSANFDEKLNEINVPLITDHMLTNNQQPITNKDNPASSESRAARGMLDDIEGLNGATFVMQSKIAKWANQFQPDYRLAREWLGNTCKMYGSDIVKDAFASVEAKVASGDIVAAPLKLMTKICQQQATERDKAAPQKLTRRPAGMPEAVWQQIQANMAKGQVAS